MAMMSKTKLLRSNEDGEMAVQDNAFGFNHVVRGYSPEEVNDYINNLSDSYRNTQTVLNKQREEFEAEKEMLVCEITDMKESRDQYKQQAEEMQATIEELREEILALAAEEGAGGIDESTANEMARLMEENSKLVADIESVNNANKELENNIRVITAEKERLVQMQAESSANDGEAVKAMAEKQKELEGRIESLKAERQSLERKLEAASNQLDGASDEELEVLRMENNDLVEKNRSLSIEMAKTQKKYRLASEEIEKAVNAKAELEERVAKMSSEKEFLDNNLARITSEKEAIESDISKLTTEKEELADSIAQITIEKEELANSIARITTEKNELSSSVEQMKSQNAKLNEELEFVKLENEEMNKKTQSIKETLAGLMQGI